MPKKADRNQPLFTAAARALGFLVQPIHMVGQGAPDLIVAGFNQMLDRWDTLLVELKCPMWNKSYVSPEWTNTLTPEEQKWHVDWRHAPVIITNRLRWVLAWFGWSDDEIRAALVELLQDKTVKAALRRIERRDGCISAEIMATIEF